MIDIKSRVDSVADSAKWGARGASFVAKLKATKAVWFPGKPVETGQQAVAGVTRTTAGASKQATKTATKTASGAAKKRAGKSTKRASGAAKKTTGTAKRATKRTAGAAKKTGKASNSSRS